MSQYISLTCCKKEFNRQNRELIDVSYNLDLDSYVDNWLLDESKWHLSILGEFGTGKTWFSLHYAAKKMEEYLHAKRHNEPRPRIPLIVPLRDYTRAVTIESLFSEFFFRKHELAFPGYSVFERMNRMGRFLFIFDGFDETALRINRQKIINNFNELAKVLPQGAKAILTCRTEYFLDIKEGRELFDPRLKNGFASGKDSPRFEVVEIEKFSESQIIEILKRTCADEKIRAITANEELMDLAKRPLITSMVADAAVEMKSDTQIDLARICYYAFLKKIRDDIHTERTFSSMADILFFLCEISWEMLYTNSLSLNYRDFPDRLQCLFGEKIKETKELDHWQHDLLGNSMLVHTEDGDYSPAHRSMTEFFAAFKMVAEMGVLDEEFHDLARQQKQIDTNAPPQEYTWSEYFTRKPSVKPALKKFKKESYTDGKFVSYVNIDYLTHNSIAFASRLISYDANSLRSLCIIAEEGEGVSVPNALFLLPYLKKDYASHLANMIIETSCGKPLRNGVSWLLGELGISTPKVLDAITHTVESFASGKYNNAHAWWECGFALEKLGVLEKDQAVDKPAIAYLLRNLPPNITLEGALDRFKTNLASDSATEARVQQCDIAIIAGSLNYKQALYLYKKHITRLNFRNDICGKRLYYSIWLCGHLKITKSIEQVIEACKFHSNCSVRNCASEALGKIGVRTDSVIAALEDRLSDAYYRARFHAAGALLLLHSKESTPALRKQATVEEVYDVKKELIRIVELLNNKS